MEWDLGPGGVALMLGMAAGFGVAAQLIMWKVTPHWFWLVATTFIFVMGLMVSEVWFGWATEEDLQPNIDGLSFDEVLLFSILSWLFVMFVTWLVGRRLRTRHQIR